VNNKYKYIVRHSGAIERMWMKLNNMLVYAFTRTVTCGEDDFTDEQHQIVSVILDGLCSSFATDSAQCAEIDPTTITCNTFEQDYIKLILRIIKDIGDKMNGNSSFDDLRDKLNIIKRLIECATTDYLEVGGGSEVHSSAGSIAVIKVGELTDEYKAELTHVSSSTTRRNLATLNEMCSVQFDTVADNLRGRTDLVVKIEYDQSCSENNKVCDMEEMLTTSPKCCKISVESSSIDFSGAIKVQKREVTSDQNGQATLALPTDSCPSNSECIYFDEAEKCWSKSGLSMQGD